MVSKCSLFVASLSWAAGSCAYASQVGIGDPTFPELGNRGYRVEHYGLKLNYAPDSNFLSCLCMIDGHLDSDSRSVTLDFKGLTIRSVRMDGHKA